MKSHRTDLKSIARRAMIERGLLPDFSADAMAELARIQTAATVRHSNMRDLTGLLWASIDNDDSRDLDQLTVAEARSDRSVKILVAIAYTDMRTVGGRSPAHASIAVNVSRAASDGAGITC